MTHPGGVSDYVAGVRRVLEASYDVELKELGDGIAVVGHRSDFRLRWGAVRLHTVVTVLPVPLDVSLQTLEDYLAASGRAAAATAGRARGLQVGAAAVAVAVLPGMSPVAQQWAERAHGHDVAVVGYPVAVGVEPPGVVQPARMRTGAVYRGFLREVVRDVVTAPLDEGA